MLCRIKRLEDVRNVQFEFKADLKLQKVLQCFESIEAARRALTRHMKRAGRVWIRVFPDLPVSKKPAEVRMGSGKGTPELWVARVKPGRVIFEIDGVTVQTAKEALSLAAAKLPIKTRFVARIAE